MGDFVNSPSHNSKLWLIAHPVPVRHDVKQNIPFGLTLTYKPHLNYCASITRLNGSMSRKYLVIFEIFLYLSLQTLQRRVISSGKYTYFVVSDGGVVTHRSPGGRNRRAEGGIRRKKHYYSKVRICPVFGNTCVNQESRVGVCWPL